MEFLHGGEPIASEGGEAAAPGDRADAAHDAGGLLIPANGTDPGRRLFVGYLVDASPP